MFLDFGRGKTVPTRCPGPIKNYFYAVNGNELHDRQDYSNKNRTMSNDHTYVVIHTYSR